MIELHLAHPGSRPSAGLEQRARGSVLVPVVAAMLILSLAGLALAELFSAQRTHAVLALESARALWIAEAGAARSAAVDYSPPVVTSTEPIDELASAASASKQGQDKLELVLTSTAATAGIVAGFSLSANAANPLVDKLKLDGDDPDRSGPLGGPGSVGSAYNPKDDELELGLINEAGVDLEIQSFSLSADRAVPELDKFELASDAGNPSERVVPAGGAAGARFEFKDKIAPGPISFTLVLNFTNGSSFTLVLSLVWVDQ